MPEANGTSGDAKSRAHHDGSSGRAFTVEQKAAVIRVKKCKATDFYDILGLEEKRSTCTDSEIKKAYRKLSLLTHPDKNGYPGADEAFKRMSVNWEKRVWVLGPGLTMCAHSGIKSLPNTKRPG